MFQSLRFKMPSKRQVIGTHEISNNEFILYLSVVGKPCNRLVRFPDRLLYQLASIGHALTAVYHSSASNYQLTNKYSTFSCTLITFLPNLLSLYSLCRSMSAKPAGKCCQRKRTSPCRPRTRWNCIKQETILFSIQILTVHLYINAFTCSWYVSYTYHPLVNIHVISMYRICTTPVYWSRMGPNRYGTNWYSLIFLIVYL